MINTSETANRLPRSIVYLTLVASFAPLALMLVGVDWGSATPKLTLDAMQGLSGGSLTDAIHYSLRGSYTHTLLEWSALCVALFTVALAFVHYRIVKDVTTPLIAMALLASGAMDAFHTLAADRLIEVVAENRDLIPFTWAICRVFNAIILMVGVGLLLWRRRERLEVKSTSAFLVLASVGFMGLAYAIIHYAAGSSTLPQTQFPDSIITRPWDLGPLILFAISGIFLYPKFYKNNRSVFAHALLISVIPALMTQAHMAFGSSSLFDSNFNVAHYLKVVSYLIPMAGLLFDYLNTHRLKEQVVLQLEDEVMERRTSQAKIVRIGRELRETEARSAQRTAYLEGVFSSSNSGMILTTDNEGVVMMMSAGSEALLGYNNAEVCGEKNIIDFIEIDKSPNNSVRRKTDGVEEIDRWAALTALARVGLTDRCERQIFSRTGVVIPVDLSISAVYRADADNRELEGFLFYGIDIRETKEREELVLSASKSAAEAQAAALSMAEENESRRLQLEEAMAQIELSEMELRASQKQIEEVTSTINESIWSMDAETQTFTYLSEACETLFGFLPGDYLTRADLLESAIHADDKSIYFENLGNLERGQRVDFDFRITDARGVSKWVKAIASPIEFDGDRATRFTGSFSDITELREATEALQQSEARVRAILENVVDGIVTLDSAGRIQMSNPAMSLLFGFSAEEFHKKQIGELISLEHYTPNETDNPGFMRKTLEQASLAEDCSMTAFSSDGRKFPIEVAFSEFQLADKHFYIAVVRDITERIAQQDFLAQAEKNTAISALAAGVAHEFKNCLGGIMGNATLALDYQDETDLVTESLEKIVEISDKANRIALSLLSYAQTGASDDAVSSAHLVIHEAKILVEGECRERNVRLRIDIDDQLFVTIDPTNLQQVIINVTLNAIQASEIDSVVHVRGFKENDFGVLEIRDSGCGMGEEEIRRAFDPFYSSKGVWGDDASCGQGLGLTTSKNIIEKSGGSIELRSRRESGTTVEIRLPLGQSEDKAEESPRYENVCELPVVLIHQFTDSSLSDLRTFLDELQTDWKPLRSKEELEQALTADVGIVILDGMAPSKIEFVQMFERVRELRRDIRIVVVVDAVYDYYIVEYVKSADFMLQRPISISSVCLALSVASPAHVSTPIVS